MSIYNIVKGNSLPREGEIHNHSHFSRPEIITKSAGWEPPTPFRNDLMSRYGGGGKSLTKEGIMLASALIKMPRTSWSLKIQDLYSRQP
jgi:hypothetical protein